MAPFGLPIFRPQEKLRQRPPDQFRAVVIAQHSDESGIHILQMTLAIGEIDSLLQGLKKIGEARFIFAFLGDIPRENTDALLRSVALQSVHRALEISQRASLLQSDAQNPGPMTPFEEERDLAPRLGEAAAIRNFHKLIEPAPHQF